MEKISNTQVSQMMKTAAENLRALSEENVSLKDENSSLKEKVASFEKKEHAEKIASMMEQKGLEPNLTLQDKIAALLRKDNLDVIEEAVSMSAPQMKLASIHEDSNVPVEGDAHGDSAAAAFAANLISLE